MEEYRLTLPKELMGRLWHTTHPDRFKQIMKDAEISPNPAIPEKERWKTSRGPEYYPFVRTLNGVSLFDFKNFDEVSYGEKYPLSNWREFVPCRSLWDEAIWLEIDRAKASDNLIGGKELIEKWKKLDAYKHTIMPMIEVAYIGAIPLHAFRNVLICRSGESVLREIPINNYRK